MMVGYISPHHPFDPPAPYSTMYDPNSLHLLPGYTGSAAPLRFYRFTARSVRSTPTIIE